MKSKLFFGGIPTEPDVLRIMAAIHPEEGDEILHETVEDLIGCSRKSARYRTITAAWRNRMMRDHNVHIAALFGKGFTVLRPTERVEYGIKRGISGVRTVRKGAYYAERAPSDQLDAVDKQKQMHMSRLATAVIDAANQSLRVIAPPKPAAQLPRRT